MIRRSDRRLASAVLAVAIGVGSVATCGGDEPAELTGFRRDPAPNVGDFSLPDLANGGEEFSITAPPGEILLVYFGYTNCPDFCPTTMSDVKLARNRLDDADAERVDVALVTIDPDRDLPILADYVQGFVPDGHALGTDDASELAQVAAPFGVTYVVDENPDTGEIEVTHSTWLYAVDDAGNLLLTWQFGVTIDELAKDLEILLDQIDDEEAA
jgi:protein SCO1/2